MEPDFKMFDFPLNVPNGENTNFTGFETPIVAYFTLSSPSDLKAKKTNFEDEAASRPEAVGSSQPT